jgi:acyl-CoA oxidase
MKGITTGLTPKQSWDQHAGLMLAEASTAFIYSWIFKTFMEGVMRINNEALRTVMNRLLGLYGVTKILDNAAGFYEGKILDSAGFKLAFAAKEKFLNELRNDALGLVEAFQYDDNTLASAIGRYDGRAYETLFDWAKNHNRVNRPEVQKEFADMMVTNRSKLQIPKL